MGNIVRKLACAAIALALGASMVSCLGLWQKKMQHEIEEAPYRGWHYQKSSNAEFVAPTAMIFSSDKQKYGFSNKVTRLCITLGYGYLAGTLQHTVMISFAEEGSALDCQLAKERSGGFYARFDDGDFENTWTSVWQDDYSRSSLMVVNERQAAKFINKIRQAKQCWITVNIEDVGLTTFMFECEGLDWDY